MEPGYLVRTTNFTHLYPSVEQVNYRYRVKDSDLIPVPYCSIGILLSGKNGTWIKWIFNGQVGWVNWRFLEVVNETW